MLNQPVKSNKFQRVFSGAAALALALCLSAAAHARQEQQQSQQQGQQQDPQQAQPQQPDVAPPPPPATRSKPVYASQDADKPPYSQDRSMRNAPGAPPRAMQNDQYSQGEHAGPPPQADQPVPPSLTVPPGTIVIVRINEFLSSDKNQVGDPFTGVLEQPIIVNGWVVARPGQVVTGKVKEVEKAGRVKGVSKLGVELTDLTLVDGRQVPVLTELWKGSGGTTHGNDAATIVGGTGVGAAIGAAADWGTGAAIGAGAGAVAGIATVLLTRGRPTILAPESELSFRLVDPVKIDTTQSQQAFFPVSQDDYENGRLERRGPPRFAGAYPGYPYTGYYAPFYGYPGYYWYPGYPYVGFYGGYWWGGSRFRGGFGRGFRR
jgi:hypothetical protein